MSVSSYRSTARTLPSGTVATKAALSISRHDGPRLSGKAELTFRALPGFLGGVSLKQMGLWSFNGIDDGLTGRSVASLDFAPDLGIFRPTLAVTSHE
jgi:hypothetical protein